MLPMGLHIEKRRLPPRAVASFERRFWRCSMRLSVGCFASVLLFVSLSLAQRQNSSSSSSTPAPSPAPSVAPAMHSSPAPSASSMPSAPSHTFTPSSPSHTFTPNSPAPANSPPMQSAPSGSHRGDYSAPTISREKEIRGTVGTNETLDVPSPKIGNSAQAPSDLKGNKHPEQKPTPTVPVAQGHFRNRHFERNLFARFA